jgi:autotransporter-associated beta strand protein
MTTRIHFVTYDAFACNKPKLFLLLLCQIVFFQFLAAQTTYSWRNDQFPPNNASWLSTTPFYFWNGTTGQVPPGSEILFFDGNEGVIMTNNLTATNRYRISFGAINAASRTINGATANTFFDFGGNAPAIINNSGVNHTINFPILNGNTNGANRLEFNAANGNLTIGSTVAGSGGGTRNIVAMGASTVFFNGVISNGASTVNFIKEGTGTATLNVANTYTGSTTITDGTLNLSTSGVLPSANAITINGGIVSIENAGALTATNNIALNAGTLRVGNVTSGATVNIGTLSITAGAIIDMGTGSNPYNLTIANSSGLAAPTLVINNWTPSANKKIFFTNTTHINTVLANINFTGYGIGAKLLPTNELVPALLFVTQPAGSGNFSVGGSWLNGAPSANNGTETIYIQPGFTLTQNTNFNVLNADIGGTLVMNAVNNLTVAAILTHSGNINMVAGSTINMSSGANWNNTGGTFSGSPAGVIHFNGSGTVAGTVTFPNVVASGAVDFGTGSTIGGSSSLTINPVGSVFTNAPTYAAGSTLIYNTTFGYNRNDEWKPGNSGPGVPHHVRVNTGAILNLDVSAAYSAGEGRTLLGNLDLYGTLTMGGTVALFGSMDEDLIVGGDLIIRNTGSFTLGCQQPATTISGDLYLAGNWTHETGGVFVPSERAVFFNGTNAEQTVNFTGTEQFSYFIVTKSGNGNVRLNCDVNVFGTNSGHPLQLYNGNIDLNGRAMTFRIFNITPHNILIDGTPGNLIRQIFNSSATPAFFHLAHADSIAIRTTAIQRNSANASLLSFGTNVIVTIGSSGSQTAGIDFGNTISTINGTLRIDARGFVSANPPTYANNSLLQYNTAGIYSRATEWNAAAGPGYPFNVQVSNTGTQVVAGGSSNTAVTLNMAGSLTIDAGTIFTMAGGVTNMTVPLNVGFDITINGSLTASPVANGNIVLGRNWFRNNTTGTFTHNNRSVTFNSASNSGISVPSGSEVYHSLIISKSSSANTVTLNSPVQVNNSLTLTTGIVVTRVIDAQATPTNLLTLIDDATSTAGSTSSFVAGPIRKIGNDAFTYPLGKVVGSEYHYRTIGISAPSAATDEFTAEFWRDNPYNRGPISAAAYGAGLSHISRCEYWDLTKSTGASDVNVTLSWSNNPIGKSNCNTTNPNLVYVDNLAALVVVPFFSNQWGDQNSLYFGQSSVPGPANPVSPALGFITWNGGPATIDTYLKFTLGSTDWRFNPLPFSLLNFEAKAGKDEINLYWKVRGNDQQQEYKIEHSSDGIVFNLLGSVQALSGLTEASYSKVHSKPVQGWNYYRVIGIDFRGQPYQSQIVKVWFSKEKGNPIVFPNPLTGNQVNVYTNGMTKGNYSVQITAVDGRLLVSKNIYYDGIQPVLRIETPGNFPAGVYWLTITGSKQDPIRLKVLIQ